MELPKTSTSSNLSRLDGSIEPSSSSLALIESQGQLDPLSSSKIKILSYLAYNDFYPLQWIKLPLIEKTYVNRANRHVKIDVSLYIEVAFPSLCGILAELL